MRGAWKTWNYFMMCLTLVKSYFIAPRKTQPGELPQEYLCVDYCALNSSLPPVVKAHFKAQGILIWCLYQYLVNYTQC